MIDKYVSRLTKIDIKTAMEQRNVWRKNRLFIDLRFHLFNRININVPADDSFLGKIHCPKTLSALFFECVLNVYL